MLDAIRDFFHEALAQPERRERHHLTLELASAALLCEVMRADFEQTGEAGAQADADGALLPR